MRPSIEMWKKVLSRWATAHKCGERDLLLAVIATAITDAQKEEKTRVGPITDGLWMTPTIRLYCRLVGLSHEFLVREARRVFASGIE